MGLTHTCPVPGGTAQIMSSELMCATHWYSVPKAIRSALWRAWRNGSGAGTSGHVKAMRACIDAADATIRCSADRI